MNIIPDIQTSDYNYHLPDDKIAKYPVEPRDSSKLMVYRQGKIEHAHFFDLVTFLPADSFLVFNDTKVIPARLHFQKTTGAIVEVFLLQPEQPSRILVEAMQQTQGCIWACMIGNKKRWKVGEMLSFEIPATDGQPSLKLSATLIDADKNWVSFDWNTSHTFVELIQAIGQIPLPPYLNRQASTSDASTYQTVYSAVEGAVAAPTAGLHFTEKTFKNLSASKIGSDFVTLHVGAGTFQPVKVLSAAEHQMHCEQVVYRLDLIENLIKHHQAIVAVGTTSMRSLESLYWMGVRLIMNEDDPFFIPKLYPYQHTDSLPTVSEALEAIKNETISLSLTTLTAETQIFILPGYDFKICKGLITNYHQPDSTLMLLVGAFVGPDWQKIYTEALANDYRFLSYGDSSLLMP
jgi:S-adenosylmethionine:tRNA ribosyltransferase-isomerase